MSLEPRVDLPHGHITSVSKKTLKIDKYVYYSGAIFHHDQWEHKAIKQKEYKKPNYLSLEPAMQ